MYDLIILGSGPAGLSAAIYASRAGLKFAVIEKDFMGTGQIVFAERVDNYPGFYNIDGYSLGEKLREHAEALGTEFIEGEVTALSKGADVWNIALSDGGSLEAKTVIYALGASPRRLGIKGENEYLGRGVSFCAVCDGAFFAGKIVAVVGGGDTALSDALYLSKTAEKVYLIHRRDEFRANKTLSDRVRAADNIELVLNAVPTEIVGGKSAEGVVITQNNETRTIAVSGVFVAVGTIPNTAPVRGVADLDGGGYVVAGEECVTSSEGLFAAGDVRTKNVRQVITAASDGANAVISAGEYLDKIR